VIVLLKHERVAQNIHQINLKTATSKMGEEKFPWHLGVFDAHCHPTDIVSSIDLIPSMKAKVLTIMATRGQDQDVVAYFADVHGVTNASLPRLFEVEKSNGFTPCQIIPSFGWHPWFSHQIYDDSSAREDLSLDETKMAHYKSVLEPSPDDSFLHSLPDPRPLSEFLNQIRRFLERYPLALIGEIGLDRTFRIPDHREERSIRGDPSLTPGTRDGKPLTPYRVSMNHQRRILKAQLNLAGELRRPVSVHGVAAHGIVFETLKDTWRGYERVMPSIRDKKRRSRVADAHLHEDDVETHDDASTSTKPEPFPPRICLHSYSGPLESLKQYLHSSTPATVFFSFSQVINFPSDTSKAADVIKAIPNERILVESDVHCAGALMDDLLEQMVRRICKLKQWTLEEGTRQLASNWLRFVFGKDTLDGSNSST
jgi:Tat protein secretion system quality control protein TatD with DNase activity